MKRHRQKIDSARSVFLCSRFAAKPTRRRVMHYSFQLKVANLSTNFYREYGLLEKPAEQE